MLAVILNAIELLTACLKPFVERSCQCSIHGKGCRLDFHQKAVGTDWKVESVLELSSVSGTSPRLQCSCRALVQRSQSDRAESPAALDEKVLISIVFPKFSFHQVAQMAFFYQQDTDAAQQILLAHGMYLCFNSARYRVVVIGINNNREWAIKQL